MVEFITPKGEYNYLSFKIEKKTFTLVGSEVPAEYKNAMDMIDTFKSSENVFSTRTRKEIREAYKDKKLEIIESSLIVPGVYDKKKFQQSQGRAT